MEFRLASKCVIGFASWPHFSWSLGTLYALCMRKQNCTYLEFFTVLAMAAIVACHQIGPVSSSDGSSYEDSATEDDNTDGSSQDSETNDTSIAGELNCVLFQEL